jgi:hypothetical protein
MGIAKKILFIAVCAAIGVGNYHMYEVLGIWLYLLISIACGSTAILIIQWRIREDQHRRQILLAKYAVDNEETLTDIKN